MDLNLVGRVLRRFWWLVALGLIVGLGLAFLSMVRVSSHGVTYRKHEVWQSQTLLLLTQQGFPWGRTVFPSAAPSSASSSAPPYADPGRFSSLTDLYSQFANGDQVRQIMRRQGAPPTWKIVATSVTPSVVGTTLPVVALSGQAYTRRESVEAAAYGRRALIQYVEGQQKAAGIPASQRISLQILKRATRPVLIHPRSKSLPVVVFLAIMIAALGLAFVLENLKPRVHAVASKPASKAALGRTRRTA